MTWKELAKKIEGMKEDQKNTDVTICIENEYYGIDHLRFTDDREDRLEHSHPVLVSDFWEEE